MHVADRDRLEQELDEISKQSGLQALSIATTNSGAPPRHHLGLRCPTNKKAGPNTSVPLGVRWGLRLQQRATHR
jgi:hypothetical protein